MANVTVKSLQKESKNLVSKRIKTAAAAAKPAVTKAAKKLQTAAKKELKHLLTEQRVVSSQIQHRQEFDKLAKANATPADKGRRAKPPGKRVSKTGKVYFESRTNRADSSRTTRI